MKYFDLAIENKADTSDVVEIYVDGRIGSRWDEIEKKYVTLTKEQMQLQLKAVGAIAAKEIHVFINSYGGDVNHGVSMHDLLALNAAEVTTDQRGHTASAASVLAQCANEGKRRMSGNALTLAHNASTIAWGDKNEMKIAVSDLEKVDQSLAKIYSKRSGKTVDDCLELMNRFNGRGEWLTADEAKTWGLVDDVYEPMKAAACIDKDLLSEMGLPEIPSEKLDLIKSIYKPQNLTEMKINWNAAWAAFKSFFDFSTPGDEKTEINAETTIDNLTAELNVRQQTIDTLTKERDAANGTIATHVATIAKHEGTIAEHVATISKNDGTIAERDATIVTLRNSAGATGAEATIVADLPTPKVDADEEVVYCATHTHAENVAYLAERRKKK